MKRLVFIGGLLVAIAITSCEAHRSTHVTSDPKADSPGSGAKMLNAGGKIHSDTTIIDSNYGNPDKK